MCRSDGRVPRIDAYKSYVKNVYATEMKVAKDSVKGVEKAKCKWRVFERELADWGSV